MNPIRPLKVTSDMAIYASGVGTPGANTDFFTTDLTVPTMAQRMTVTIAVSSASTLSAFHTNGSDVALKLNGGSALAAGALYFFVWEVRPEQTWNLQIDTTADVTYLAISCSDGGI